MNYIALTGALHAIGTGEKPIPPLNLVGDFGGGGMLLAYGVVCGLLETGRSGEGQVIDAAMVDGAAVLMTMFYGLKELGHWLPERGTNLLDTGSHFYDVYECADGKYVSVGSIEPQFYAELLRLSGLGEQDDLPPQMDRTQWPAMKERIAAIFRSRTRDEWCEVMDASEVCFAPVLSLDEAHQHPQNVARATFTEHHGVLQPSPAPRFSRTEPAIAGPPPHPGQHTDEILADWGFPAADIAKLRETGAVR